MLTGVPDWYCLSGCEVCIMQFSTIMYTIEISFCGTFLWGVGHHHKNVVGIRLGEHEGQEVIPLHPSHLSGVSRLETLHCPYVDVVQIVYIISCKSCVSVQHLVHNLKCVPSCIAPSKRTWNWWCFSLVSPPCVGCTWEIHSWFLCRVCCTVAQMVVLLWMKYDDTDCWFMIYDI
jgi:hypothetical protein